MACVCTNHPVADTLCLSQGLTELSPQRKTGFGVSIEGKLLLKKTDESQHIFSAEKAVSWGNNLCSSSILCGAKSAKEGDLLVAADLAVVPAGLGILQRSWSVFSSRGENLGERRIDDSVSDWLGVGARSL